MAEVGSARNGWNLFERHLARDLAALLKPRTLGRKAETTQQPKDPSENNVAREVHAAPENVLLNQFASRIIASGHT
jgi:hypothetical protein